MSFAMLDLNTSRKTRAQRMNKAGYTAQDAPCTRLKITRDRRIDGPTDGLTDGRTDRRQKVDRDKKWTGEGSAMVVLPTISETCF